MARDIILDYPQTGINYSRLTQEIREVFPNLFDGLNSHPFRAIRVDESITKEQLQLIVDAHNPAIQSDTQLIEARKNNAENELKSIPNYFTWNGSQAESWIDTNVTDLASAKQVLIALAKMNIAMRNKLFPHLEGS